MYILKYVCINKHVSHEVKNQRTIAKRTSQIIKHVQDANIQMRSGNASDDCCGSLTLSAPLASYHLSTLMALCALASKRCFFVVKYATNVWDQMLVRNGSKFNAIHDPMNENINPNSMGTQTTIIDIERSFWPVLGFLIDFPDHWPFIFRIKIRRAIIAKPNGAMVPPPSMFSHLSSLKRLTWFMNIYSSWSASMWIVWIHGPLCFLCWDHLANKSEYQSGRQSFDGPNSLRCNLTPYLPIFLICGILTSASSLNLIDIPCQYVYSLMASNLGGCLC